ncbi:MAG: hypothetical protein R6V85_16795 [Polyangia bacterium]
MTADSDRILHRVLDMAWSLWSGLGLPGQVDNHYDHLVDPEPLVVFTAALGEEDPRLRNEALDWCIRYGSLLSGSRLKNLIAAEEEHVQKRFGEFAATVAAHSTVRWPGRTQARRHTPRKRPRIDAFTRMSQMVVRLRAWIGIGVRAEILRVFVSWEDRDYSAADLAVETGYSKRSVAQVLDSLCLGNVLQSLTVRNQIRYRMPQKNVGRLRDLFAPAPVFAVRWPAVLRVLRVAFEALRRFESKKMSVRGVEVRAVVEKMSDMIRLARLPDLRLEVRGSDFWSEFYNWLLAVADNLAAGREPATDRFRSRWTRLLEPFNGESMEQGGFAVWESPVQGLSLRWTFGICQGGQPQRELDQGVRYSTVEEAKRAAETRKFTMDRQKGPRTC